VQDDPVFPHQQSLKTDQNSADAVQSERLFETIFERAAVGIALMVSNPGRFERINQRYCDIVGYSQEEMETLAPQDITYPDDRQAILDTLQRLHAGEIRRFSTEIRYIRKDGSIVWVTLSVSPLRDQGGEPHTHIAVVTDITMQKRTEEELRKRETELNESQRLAHIGSWDWDAATDTIIWSTEFYRIHNIDPALPAPNYLDHLRNYTLESAERLDAAIAKARQTGEPYELELELANQNAEMRWVLACGEAKRDAEGRFLGLRGITQDITERRRAAESLRENQERLDLALRSAHMGVWSWNIIENKRYFDDQVCHLLGIDPATFTGAAEEFFRVVHPEDVENIREALVRTIEMDVLYEPEYRAVWPDGSIHYITSRGRLVRDDRGQALRVSGIIWDITGRRKMEEALRKSETRLREAQKIGRMGDWETDIETNALSWSDQTYEIFGIKPVPGVTLTLDDFITRVHPDDRLRVSDFLKETVERAVSSWQTEYRIVLDSGDERHIFANARVEMNAQGRPIRRRGIILDITERKKAEQTVKESEKRFRTLFEAAPDAIFLANPETGTIIDANTAAETLLLRPRAEIIGMHQSRLHPPDMERKMKEQFSDHAKGSRPEGVEAVVLQKNGNRVPVHIEAHLINLGGITVLQGVFRDISEFKRIADMLKERTRLLEESQRIARIGSYAFHITSGLWESSPVMDEIFGIDDPAYLKDLDGWLRIIHPAEREEMRHYLMTDVVNGRRPFDRAYRIVRFQDGEERWVHGRGELVLDREGRVVALIGTIQDITEEKRAEEHRRKLEEQLQQAHKLESLGVLAGGIAHDFNNLLQGVFGYVSMAKLSLDRREKTLAMLEQAEKALTMSVNLAKQLLAFSKGGKPVRMLIRLHPVIENSVKFALSGSHADCQLDIADNLWPVEADEGQLAQVIQNIVLNANEALPGSGTVRVSAENIDIPRGINPSFPDGGRFVRIAIQDQGIGIPEQHLSRIFDPYFTTKQRGSGLGLATSYAIMRNHGGMIEVTSEVNKGSMFSLYLPAAEHAEAEAKATTTTVSEKRGRVLVMDDEDLVRNVAKEMIVALGHEVECASDGTEAIEIFRQARETGKPFDVVIFDLTVKGGMGGEEAIRRIREIEPDVAAVVSSGYADNPVVADYRTYGFSSSLNKPYKIETVRDCLNVLLS
jgi:two-component system, cell cycle sensor histidine kinase and response regulator CckA